MYHSKTFSLENVHLCSLVYVGGIQKHFKSPSIHLGTRSFLFFITSVQ